MNLVIYAECVHEKRLLNIRSHIAAALKLPIDPAIACNFDSLVFQSAVDGDVIPF